MSSKRRTALGRGLGALLGDHERPQHSGLPEVPVTPPAATDTTVDDPNRPNVQYISVDRIERNPDQPRQHFSADSLEELATSIRQHGVLQPVLLTRRSGTLVLVAGERRFRAAQIAGLTEIPALIQEMTEEEMLEIALVENVQRDDLNPVEEARAYRRLVDAFGWSQEQVASRVGKKRSTVSNALRLLKLGDDALRDLEDGRLSAGHARAILSIDDAFYRQKLRQEIVEKGISVREAEKRAARYQKGGAPTHNNPRRNGSTPANEVDIVAIQDGLMAHLGCRIRLRTRDGQSGVLEIPFQSPEELDRFFDAVGYRP